MIKASIKRILHFFPYVAAYFLALVVAAMAFAFFAENVLFKDGAFSMVHVAFYMPSDNQLNSVGFSFISHMNSIENSITFDECDDPEEVREMVDEGDVVAGLIIPDNFLSGIYYGNNPEIEVVFKSAETFDEQVVKDIMLVLANDLGIGQACTQTVYSFCDEIGLDDQASEDFASDIRSRELEFAMDRIGGIFDYETIDSITAYTLTQRVTGAVLVYIYLLSVFVFSYFCKGSNPAFIARAKLSGIHPAAFFGIEGASVFFMMYASFVLVVAGLKFTKIGVSYAALYRMIPVLIIIALMVTLVSYLFRSPVTAAYVSFSVFTVMMYLAGGLMPLEFLPKFLQESAPYNPFKYIIDITVGAMFS
ncbi:MAG: ABC transporter permease [Clostridiales bacterium]|nr:ABC transporter permease [Clostridiales bacterium]